jgi:heme exporter protein CcmD
MDNPHFAFITAAYAIAALVLAGMAAAILLDYRRLRRALVRLNDPRELGDERADS